MLATEVTPRTEISLCFSGARQSSQQSKARSSRSIPASRIPRSLSTYHETRSPRALWRRVRASSSPSLAITRTASPPPLQAKRPVSQPVVAQLSPPPPLPPPPSSPLYPQGADLCLVDDAQTSASPSSTSSRRADHAAGGLGAAVASGEPVGARDEPAGGQVDVGSGVGDRAAAGRDARDAARPPRVRVRALPHRPRREDHRRRGPFAAPAAAEREEGGEPEPPGEAGRAVRVRQAVLGAAEDGEARLVEAARRQRERAEQLPQQQRRRAAQLLHAPRHLPQLHRAAPRRPPRARRPRRLQQEGKGQRHRQVLADDAMGQAVAEVQPAGPGRRVARDPEERRESLKILTPLK